CQLLSLDKTVHSQIKEFMTNPPLQVETQEQFIAGLLTSMLKGKALQWSTQSPELLGWIDTIFQGADEKRMGGQSGIITNLMARLKIEHVLIYTPFLSTEQALVFNKGNIFVPVNEEGILKLKTPRRASKPTDPIKINWIFEYQEGLVFEFDGKMNQVPRTNRFILASRPSGLRPLFDPMTSSILPEIGILVDRVIMSGYQYLRRNYKNGLTYKQYLDLAVRHLKMLKSQNPRLRIHMEFASIRDESIREEILRTISPQVHSFGCNEVEIIETLRILGLEQVAQKIEESENAQTLFKGILTLMEELKFERIHLHTLGYHIVMIKKNYPCSPKGVRTGCLFASNIAATKALLGTFSSADIETYELQMGKRISISFKGISELQNLGKYLQEENQLSCLLEEFMIEGISHIDNNRTLIFVPAQITPIARSTVGLGDSISSSAFIFDLPPHDDEENHSLNA
ncbi:MAG: ADP-dependent glucokinase/phosphofructokinase, partial [Promethearchaeota archaeon]